MTNASGQFVRPAKNDGSIDYGVSELQHERPTKKTNVSRVSKGSKSALKIVVAGVIIYNKSRNSAT